MHDTRHQTEQLWHALHDNVRRFIRRRVADDAAADDLLQQTFLKVIEGLPGLHSTDHVTGWVYQIARNTVIDHYRSERRSPGTIEGLEFDPAVPDEPDEPALNTEVGRWLLGLVESLPEPYREAIRLVEVDGLSQREAADRLGLSWSGAKSRVQRGRAMLKRALSACCELGFDRRGNVLDCHSREADGGGGCGGGARGCGG